MTNGTGLGLSSMREKSAGNPCEVAAGKCTISHLDLSCSVCGPLIQCSSGDEVEVHPELRIEAEWRHLMNFEGGFPTERSARVATCHTVD